MKQFPMVASVMTRIRFLASELQKYFNPGFHGRSLGESVLKDFENVASRSTLMAAKGSVEISFRKLDSNIIVCVDVPVTS